MLKHLVSSLLAVILLFTTSVTNAAIDACSPSSNFLIAYINGVNTTKEEARRNNRLLKEAVGTSHNGEQVEVMLAYNQTRGLLDDVVDVLRQKSREYPGVSSDLIFKALVNGTVSSLLPESLKEYVANFHINKIKESRLVSYSDDDLKDIVSAIRAKVTENRKILLVPHSQGNIYANAAFAELISGNNAVPVSAIKILGIASPAAYVAGNGDYITSSNDLVISGLRASGFSVLDANFTIGVSTDDILGHSLKDIYLNVDYEGRAEVLRKIYAAMDSLSFPGGDASQGPITVTLTWGSQPDVDLHVFEPEGTHVFYQNKVGSIGQLDLDDTNGYGPEHYYTSCDKLKVGTYIIGANYYNGSGVETATITISTPVSIITRSIYLTEALGRLGNDNPVVFMRVTIGRTSTGRLTYTII